MNVGCLVFFGKGGGPHPGPGLLDQVRGARARPQRSPPDTDPRGKEAFVGSDPRALQYTPWVYWVRPPCLLPPPPSIPGGGGGAWARGEEGVDLVQDHRPDVPQQRLPSVGVLAATPPGGWNGSPGGPQRSSFAPNTFNPVRHPTHRPMIARTHQRHRPNMPLGM